MARLEGKTVLIVEDDELVHDIHARALEKEGAEVLWAKESKEALTMLASHDVDVMLVDRLMPKLSGDALIECVADDPALSDTLMVIVSNVPLEPEDKAHFDALGVAGYCLKADTKLSQLVDEVVRVAAQRS